MAPKVKIYPLAVAKIIYHSASNPNKEIAGFLIGYFYKDTVIITDTRTGKQYGTSVHVVIDDIELAKIAEELDNLNINEKIVGWYHSHPNMGAHFFSSIDISTQKRYQMFSPNAVGIVVDPAQFIRTKNPNHIDLKCWQVYNDHAINIDYEIITDSEACLKNLLQHLQIIPDINSNISYIIEKLLPQFNSDAILKKVEFTRQEISKPILSEDIYYLNKNILKLLIQLIILVSFLVMLVLYVNILI